VSTFEPAFHVTRSLPLALTPRECSLAAKKCTFSSSNPKTKLSKSKETSQQISIPVFFPTFAMILFYSFFLNIQKISSDPLLSPVQRLAPLPQPSSAKQNMDEEGSRCPTRVREKVRPWSKSIFHIFRALR
jgi:hypothetical protein